MPFLAPTHAVSGSHWRGLAAAVADRSSSAYTMSPLKQGPVRSVECSYILACDFVGIIHGLLRRPQRARESSRFNADPAGEAPSMPDTAVPYSLHIGTSREDSFRCIAGGRAPQWINAFKARA
eukprot:gnl/TRDRNA2_/TRDRNA2_86659_c0_seq1.p1 gnl/TRDRNA2_/TRDRNA2_86659_c0~~gnl/TRDRNA2_/TRDRNA2_86659_c0_seq1.p1  ORF type:complete len:123 (+),score=2.96 gnl/TRDRNA2_/TRDRNA2_86659_c0_seq1:242-610(+)